MIGHLFGATAQAESIEKRSDLLRERIARLLEDARG
jgi:hypothetical protein